MYCIQTIWILKSSRLLLDLLCLVQYKYNNRRNASIALWDCLQFDLSVKSNWKFVWPFFCLLSFDVKGEGSFCQWACATHTYSLGVSLQTWRACVCSVQVFQNLIQCCSFFCCQKEKTQFFFSAWTVTAIQKSNFEIWIFALKFSASSSVMAILLFVVCMFIIHLCLKKKRMHASLISIVIEALQSCWSWYSQLKAICVLWTRGFFSHTFNANHKYMNSRIIPRFYCPNLWIKARQTSKKTFHLDV